MCKEGECLECMTIDRNQLSNYLDNIARFLIDSGSVKTDDMMQEEISDYVVESVTALRAELADAKARAKTAEENWHANEVRLGKLEIADNSLKVIEQLAEAWAEATVYDVQKAFQNIASIAKKSQ